MSHLRAPFPPPYSYAYSAAFLQRITNHDSQLKVKFRHKNMFQNWCYFTSHLILKRGNVQWIDHYWSEQAISGLVWWRTCPSISNHPSLPRKHGQKKPFLESNERRECDRTPQYKQRCLVWEKVLWTAFVQMVPMHNGWVAAILQRHPWGTLRQNVGKTSSPTRCVSLYMTWHGRKK